MKCPSNRTITGAAVGVLSPILALALTPAASAQCSAGTCGSPPFGHPENETCIEDNGEDTTNTGCNADVPSVTDFTEVTALGDGPFLDAELWCGIMSTFRVGDPCVDDNDCAPPDPGSCDNGLCTPANFRDTDWYRITPAALASFDTDGDGRVLLSARLRSEFDGAVFLIDIEDVDLCDVTTTLDSTTTQEAELGGCGVPGETIDAVITLADSPNGIGVVVTTDGLFGTGVPCSQSYLLELWAGDVLAVCGTGGPCNTPNASPGCEDPECCQLVCELDPSCCLPLGWTAGCVDLAINEIGCAFEPYSCDNPEPGQPDCCDALSASPPLLVTDGTVFNFDTTNANSDGAPNENPNCSGNTPTGIGKDYWFRFEATEAGTLTASTCQTASPSAFDTLIEVYDGGLIGDAYDCEQIKGRALELFCNDAGGQGGFSTNPCTAGDGVDNAHVHFEVEVGRQYIIRMAGFNEEIDFGPGSITFNFVPGEPLFYTGRHELVLFDGNATNLGWISGALNETGLDTQRRTAQGFTLPELPPGPASEWEITEIYINGFQAEGDLNEQIHFEFFSRTPGTAGFPDWPGPEPTPADSLGMLTVPMTSSSEDSDGPQGNDDRHAFDVQAAEGTPFTLPPGDYWMTMWGSNDDVPFQSSSLAWFTNAPEGINNFCTPDSALDYPDAADPDQLGCDDPNSGDGTPGMYRSRIYPPVDPPNDDTGFRSYVLTAAALDVDPDNDPTPDPADLYNASFQIRGIASAGGVPCPYDCQVDAGGVPNPDGNVGINDFLTLLAQWQMAGTTCDVDPNDMGAGINDFLALLAAWGPCP